MEETLYLEPDEEITSVIDKLKNAKSNRVALVIPRGATLLQSVVNLKLLVKEATNLGKEIAVVTTDKIGRNLASQVGLAVYDSIKDHRPVYEPPAPAIGKEEEIVIDMSQPEEPPKPKGVSVHHFQEDQRVPKTKTKPQIETPWQKTIVKKQFDWSKWRKIIWPVLAIFVLLILTASYLVLPKVQIYLKVQAENYQKELETQVASGVTAEDIDNKIFPGNLWDQTKEKEEKFTATGKKNLGGKASGTLTLYNYWDSNPQNLAKGSKFSSSSKTFIAKNAVNIPGTSIRGGNIVPGTATVDIEAENPGEDYNVKAGRFSIVGLSADQQEKIYGQSSRDLTGGFSKEVTVLSQEDFDKAKVQLAKELGDELLSDARLQNSGKEILDQAIQNETVEAKSSVDVDAEAADFTLNLKQRLRLVVFDRALFDQFILTALEKQLPYDQMISLGPNGSIDLTKVEPQYDQGKLNLNVKIEAMTSTRVDLSKVKKDLLGKSRAQAENYLNNLSGVKGFEIKFSPSFWLKRIPNFDRWVGVSLEYIESPAPGSPAPSPSVSPTVEVTP